MQLGATDEAHIIRTFEYWDIERTRYPQYDHSAVLVAEDITSRFLNVISLFNGTIPLIALQMQALKVGDVITLVFTRVLDELSRGVVDEDEDAEATPTDRTYWEQRGSKQTVKWTEDLLEIARTFDPSLNLKYNKFYIGLTSNGQPYNFVIFRQRKKTINDEINLPRTSEIDERLKPLESIHSNIQPSGDATSSISTLIPSRSSMTCYSTFLGRHVRSVQRRGVSVFVR